MASRVRFVPGLLFRTVGLAASLAVAACGPSASPSAPPSSDAGSPGDDGGAPAEAASTGDAGSRPDASRDAAGDAPSDPPCGPPGTLDTAFAKTGLLVSETPMALTQESVAAISDGVDGLYVGFSPFDEALPDSTNSTSLSVVHLDGKGTLDASFGKAGRVDASYPNVVNLTGIRRGSVSGAIYLLGDSAEPSGPSTVYSSTLARVTAAGTVDTTFGGDGHVQFGGPSGMATNGYVADVVERSDGSIVVLTGGGFMHLSATGKVLGSAMASVFPYEQDTTYLGFLPAAGESLVVVGAWSGSPTQPVQGPSVARFTSSFALDTTFGTQGQAVPAIGLGATGFPHAGRTDLGMYLGGYTSIASLDASGSPVAGFGKAGIASVKSPVVATLARSDGSVLYVPTPPTEGPSIAVNALTTSGAADATFGSGGSLDVPKSITRSDASKTKIDAQYVGPVALVPAGAHRAYLVSIYGLSLIHI